MIAAGVALDGHRPAAARPGSAGVATRPRNVRRSSVAHPDGGPGAAEVLPAFDQQPIEVATLADACARAAAVDPHRSGRGHAVAAAWFEGANDSGLVMWDPETGGGFDGLLADGVNLNQGAESTLSVISTMQHAQRFSLSPNDFDALRARHPEPSADDGQPVARHHPTLRARSGGFRTAGVQGRCGARRLLALDDDDVQSALEDVIIRFDGRHRNIDATFRRHAHELADRIDPDRELSEARMLLLGATFTSEYAIEGAALCNPSVVAHPDQNGTASGACDS